MDPDPDRNAGCTDLSGKSDITPAAPVIVATPAVTRPGAGPSSAMVTRSREGRPRNKCRTGSRIQTGNRIPSGSRNTGRN